MKTEMKIQTRVYPVVIKDTRTGERIADTIVLEKSRIQAAALFDMGDEDIIYRIYNRQGYRVLEIGKPQKVELAVDLAELYSKQVQQARMERLLAFARANSDAQSDNQERDARDAE